ncbi:uncharacterized protein F4817DRAFT_205034 [Daldinia loculata]|uniref:uncharacterized protein n=1 Tax=Daldinia loculata TaxID=103429 RepID=UPI0020C543BB|nr:uncharacterized protein F4817DRAFT_205034 [Daldinia loculata]KAI1644711.1 hypothetical protein F4817DRAFT_205034 [Daldinia loculata]
MYFPSVIILALSSGAAAAVARFDVPVPARVRDDPTPTECTASAITTETTINRGSEGIWVMGPRATNINELYTFTQTDWLDNDHQKILDTCGSICLAGNNTAEAGTWLPSGKYFQGGYVQHTGRKRPRPPPMAVLLLRSCCDTRRSRPWNRNLERRQPGKWNHDQPKVLIRLLYKRDSFEAD